MLIRHLMVNRDFLQILVLQISMQIEMLQNNSNSLLLAPNANDYMFVIPQTVAAWDYASNGAYIEIQCSITKGEKTYDDSGRVYLPFTDTWEKGCIHRYNIRMGTSLRNISGAPIDFSN